MPESEAVILESGATGMFCTVSEVAPAALLVHGWKSTHGTTSAAITDALTRQGFHTFALTLCGHGDAVGDIDEVSRKDHTNDIAEARNWLRRRSDIAGLVGIGSSYGGYLLASYSASADNAPCFDALVLRSPALYPDDGWDDPTTDLMDQTKLWEWRIKVVTVGDSNALRAIKRFPGPLLLISGGKDEDIPQNVFETYFNIANTGKTKHLVISAAGHVFRGGDRELYLRQVSCWAEQVRACLSRK